MKRKNGTLDGAKGARNSDVCPMNTSTTVPSVPAESEDPLLGEIEQPHETPRCEECLFCGQCPCSLERRIHGKSILLRERVLPLFNAAAQRGGKKEVQRLARSLSTEVLEKVLGQDVYDIPNTVIAQCVEARHARCIEHGTQAELHNRSSKEQHAARRREVKESENVVYRQARIAPPTEDHLTEILAIVPPPKQSRIKRVLVYFTEKMLRAAEPQRRHSAVDTQP